MKIWVKSHISEFLDKSESVHISANKSNNIWRKINLHVKRLICDRWKSPWNWSSVLEMYSNVLEFCPNKNPWSLYYRHQVAIHEDLLQYCIDRLKASYDTVSALDRDKDSMNRIYQEASRMIRVMTVLHEYVAECDDAHGEERAILPLGRSVYLLYRACNEKPVQSVVLEVYATDKSWSNKL